MPTEPEAEPLAVARRRMQALRTGLATAEGGPVRLEETHISWVLLTAAVAYKLKKPVQLPFLDFSTLGARRHFCEEELRLNRRLAPSLYLEVVDVCDTPQGPRFGGSSEVVDVAVRMRRFPQGSLWSEMLADGRLLPGHIDAMALRLAEFHRNADVAAVDGGFGSAASHASVSFGLVDAIDAIQLRSPGSLTPGLLTCWLGLRDWLVRQSQVLAPRWTVRLREGHVRECHGDLHLANVLQLDGMATAFDCLEFDPALRWIDVMDDMSFLATDLLAHGRASLAFRFINAYLEATGDYDGLPVLRFYMVCRALVRAQVTHLRDPQGAQTGAGCSASGYLQLASALSCGADPRLAVMHGLPGSGKSFVSQGVIETFGAIRVRSDVERKRLFGLGPLESSRGRVPGGIYSEPATVRTYERLQAVAGMALDAGWPVVVDAAFLKRSERAPFAQLCASLSVPFSILDCQAELPLLRLRVKQRGLLQTRAADASEADGAVLERLVDVVEPFDDRESMHVIAVDQALPPLPAVLAEQWRDAAPVQPR